MNRLKYWNLTTLMATLLLIAILAVSCSNDNPNGPSMSVPVLTTAEVSEVMQTTAECGGTITSDGGAAITARGVCWSTNPIPTIADSKTTDGSGTGSFTSSITGLAGVTEYYVRAYATNSVGTGYGNIDSFTTAVDSITGTVTDIDGNIYATIKIGSQWWMAENLKVTRYRNSDSIPNISDSITWINLGTGAYCNYNNNLSWVPTYGRLYNWHAVHDNHNIAPTGWHVPSDTEWKQLEMYLGMSQAQADSIGFRGTDEGGKLKESGTIRWSSPNTGATNSTGFCALPGGCRTSSQYYYWSLDAFFWTSTEFNSDYAWRRSLNCRYAQVARAGEWYGDKNYGFSVRCVRD